MTTAPKQQPNHERQYHSQYEQDQLHNLNSQLDTTTYDPDEVVPRDSPLMKALHPKLELSPSPPPEIPPGQVSSSPPSIDGRVKSNRPKILPFSGDSVLVRYLDDGRRPEIAQAAGSQALPSADDDDDDDEDEDDDDDDDDDESDCFSDHELSRDVSRRDLQSRAEDSDFQSQRREQQAATSDLQFVAVDAPHVYTTEPPPPQLFSNTTADISASARHLSIQDERQPTGDRRPRELPSPNSHLSVGGRSPAALLTPASGELPPLQIDSPKFESNTSQSLSLPSIRSTFGDIDRLPAEPPTPVERDIPSRHGNHPQGYPQSPSVGLPRLPSMSAAKHISPPISPNEAFQRNLPSPHSHLASSPFYYNANGLHNRPSIDHLSSTSGDTPKTEYTTSTPATTASVAERMSIDGITNSQVGVYACTYSGCTAAPFQTQYLLNSHANVHSSVRPHYCPVPGCPRSEGGKGFKRKNEMIRHGLVHDSPGYVCPFCADREHKYPRPDNLQRHVRVHHHDKDKDDPLLRDVLAQRPDGPNRGRRRRGAPT